MEREGAEESPAGSMAAPAEVPPKDHGKWQPVLRRCVQPPRLVAVSRIQRASQSKLCWAPAGSPERGSVVWPQWCFKWCR